jgi:hypothetical protein
MPVPVITESGAVWWSRAQSTGACETPQFCEASAWAGRRWNPNPLGCQFSDRFAVGSSSCFSNAAISFGMGSRNTAESSVRNSVAMPVRTAFASALAAGRGAIPINTIALFGFKAPAFSLLIVHHVPRLKRVGRRARQAPRHTRDIVFDLNRTIDGLLRHRLDDRRAKTPPLRRSYRRPVALSPVHLEKTADGAPCDVDVTGIR